MILIDKLKAIILDIFKVDGGDSMFSSILQHVASQAPVLGVRAELQDLVMVATTTATWMLHFREHTHRVLLEIQCNTNSNRIYKEDCM